ncbi:MAG: hypothetical protein RLZZ292_779 [Bacteroidota bacterium]|jgi:hypothetical protein
MNKKFLKALKKDFPAHAFSETTLSDKTLFVYEQEEKLEVGKNSFTVLSPNTTKDNFKINNINKLPITHICIDGDFIPFAQQEYIVGDGQIGRKRNDCIVFSEKEILFVELKLNVTTEEEKGKRAKLFEGMKQIKTFFLYLKEGLAEEFSYFPVKNCHAIVVMPSSPSFEGKRNAQLNNELSKFKEATGLNITLSNKYSFSIL